MRAAQKAPDPARTLRTIVLELTAEGCAKQEIAALLEKLLLEMREQPEHHDGDEDAVLDVLDGFAGRASAH